MDNTRESEPLSRTRRKQQAKQIEHLAQRLVELDEQQFRQLQLPEEIVREARTARTTRGRGSQRRQVKYLAAWLRESEEVLQSVLAQLQDLDQVARGEKQQFHRLEDLRDRLCAEQTSGAALQEVREHFPAVDEQALTRLVSSVREHQDKRAYREIFRRLRDAGTI